MKFCTHISLKPIYCCTLFLLMMLSPISNSSTNVVDMTPKNVSVSPSVTTDGTFTVSWDRVSSASEEYSWYSYGYYCMWMDIYVKKNGADFDYIETKNCNVTSHDFSGYSQGDYTIIVSAYVEEWEYYRDSYEEYWYDVWYDAPPLALTVNSATQPEPTPTPVYPPNTPAPSDTSNRRVVFIHTDLLGSPAAETY